jgi:hypothetical protein
MSRATGVDDALGDRFAFDAPRPPQFSRGRGVSVTKAASVSGEKELPAPPKHTPCGDRSPSWTTKERGAASGDFYGFPSNPAPLERMM